MILTAALGVIIAAVGAFIAYFQWRTAHQRVVLELFDRRLAVFRKLEESAKGILDGVSRKDLEAPFWSYIEAESNARFLFGEEVITALSRLRANIADAMAFCEIGDEHPDRHNLIERHSAALQYIAAFIQNSSPLFAPYMRLDQKMPSLGWPGRRLR